MTKRKAEISLDKWLSKGELYIDESKARPIATTTKVINGAVTSVLEAQPRGETVVVPTAEADVSEQDAAKWFWELLNQAGYERL